MEPVLDFKISSGSEESKNEPGDNETPSLIKWPVRGGGWIREPLRNLARQSCSGGLSTNLPDLVGQTVFYSLLRYPVC